LWGGVRTKGPSKAEKKADCKIGGQKEKNAWRGLVPFHHKEMKGEKGMEAGKKFNKENQKQKSAVGNIKKGGVGYAKKTRFFGVWGKDAKPCNQSVEGNNKDTTHGPARGTCQPFAKKGKRYG